MSNTKAAIAAAQKYEVDTEAAEAAAAAAPPAAAAAPPTAAPAEKELPYFRGSASDAFATIVHNAVSADQLATKIEARIDKANENGTALSKLAQLLKDEPGLDSNVLVELLSASGGGHEGVAAAAMPKRAPLWRRSQCNGDLRLSREARAGIGEVHAAAAEAAGYPLGAALLCAATVGDDDAMAKIAELLDAGVSMNCADATGITATHIAAEYAKPWVIKFLVARADKVHDKVYELEKWKMVLDVNASDANGITPVMMAAQWGRAPSLDALIGARANVAAKGGYARAPDGTRGAWIAEPSGWTALHFAADFGAQTLDVMGKLAEAGAPLDAAANDGSTPLHIAARRGFPRAVKLLLEKGCNVAAQDERLWRALHYSCSGGHVSVSKVLLEHGGADANATTVRGYTPLWIVENFDPNEHKGGEGGAPLTSFDELRALLKEYGADNGKKQVAAQEAEVVAAAEAELDAAYADEGTVDPAPADDPVASAADATRRTDDGKPYTSDSGAAKGHGYVGHLITDLRKYGPTTWVNGKKVRGNPSDYDTTYDGAWKPDGWKSEL